MRIGLLVGLLALGAGAPAAAAPAPVRLTADGPVPSVTRIAAGRGVRWTNEDAATHQLGGAFSSPALAPAGVFVRTFRQPGQYRYRDVPGGPLRGTVIVGSRAGTYRPPSGSGGGGSGLIQHRFAAKVKLSVSETYHFYDGKWHSLKGPCNSEIGAGSRTLRLSVAFPSATYTRVGRTEVLATPTTAAHADVLREHVNALVANSQSPQTDCGDGTTDVAADHRVRCDENRTGTLGRLQLQWSSGIRGRFQLAEESAQQLDVCGLTFIGPLSIAGLDSRNLPLQLVPESFAYDSAATDPLTGAGLAALRRGRRVHAVSEEHLAFLASCCAWWVPPGEENPYSRVGSQWSLDARMEITLTPR